MPWGAYLRDRHHHVALPAAKPDVPKVDVPQRRVLRALPGCQRVGTTLIHRVQDGCPGPRRSWKKKMVLSFPLQRPQDLRKEVGWVTGTRWGWRGQQGKAFPLQSQDRGTDFGSIPAIGGSFLLQGLRG